MRMKGFLVLGGLAFCALLAAVWLSERQAPSEGQTGELLIPQLAASLNDIDRVVIGGPGGVPLLTLQRSQQGWGVVERDAYPVDVAKLRALLVALSEARIVEGKTSRPDLYARLGVEDTAAEDATGLELQLSGGSVDTRLIVGNAAGSGRYVRFADAAQALQVSGQIDAPRELSAWVERSIVNVPSAEIQQVELQNAEQQLRVAKSAEEDENFRIEAIPEGREPSSEFAANGLGGFLASLNLDDVLPADQAPEPADAVIQGRWLAFDGRVFEARVWKDGERHLLRLNVGFDTDQAQRFFRANTPPDWAQDDPADASTDAASEDSTAADAEQEFSQRVATLSSQVAEQQAQLQAWVYVIPGFKFTVVDKRMEDLLKPLEAEE